MSKKKLAKEMLKITEAKLRRTSLLPNNLIYVSIYQNACNLVSMEKYSLAIDIFKALNRQLDK